MNYIFFYRRITDIDHTVPIIHSLIIKGVSPLNIKYTDYLIDKTSKNIKDDPRIKYILKSNITFKQSIFKKFK